MAFDWSQYLSVAEVLSQSTEEGSARSAISRAYYAAFGLASNSLRSVGHNVPDDGSAHSSVWTTYKNADDGPLHFVSIDGRRLRMIRRSADYDASLELTQRDAELAIRIATSIIRSISRNPPPAPARLIKSQDSLE